MMVAESTCSTLLPEVIYPWQRGACFDASLSVLRLCPCSTVHAQTLLLLPRVWVDLHYGNFMGIGNMEAWLFFCQFCL